MRHTLDLADSAATSRHPERAASYIIATLEDLQGAIATLRRARRD